MVAGDLNASLPAYKQVPQMGMLTSFLTSWRALTLCQQTRGVKSDLLKEEPSLDHVDVL